MKYEYKNTDKDFSEKEELVKGEIWKGENKGLTYERLLSLNNNLNIFVTDFPVIGFSYIDEINQEKTCRFFSKLLNKEMNFLDCFEIIYEGFNRISFAKYKGLFWRNTYFEKWEDFLKKVNDMEFICFRFLILNKENNPIYIRYFNMDRFFEEENLKYEMNSALIMNI